MRIIFVRREVTTNRKIGQGDRLFVTRDNWCRTIHIAYAMSRGPVIRGILSRHQRRFALRNSKIF